MSWSDLSEWWLSEIREDPAYEEVVNPLLFEVFHPVAGRRYLDLGGGEGRIARQLVARGAPVTVIDVNFELVNRSGVSGVVARLPGLPAANNSVDGAYCVLTLEHLADHGAFFSEAARVVITGGPLALVMNHPTWTAPGSTPITDSDGEVLWRPGEYFSNGTSEVPAGERSVTFHHRSMSDLLQTATDSGWSLETIIERPHPELEAQAGIPRLLACSWTLS